MNYVNYVVNMQNGTNFKLGIPDFKAFLESMEEAVKGRQTEGLLLFRDESGYVINIDEIAAIFPADTLCTEEPD